jgi:hypothetical protein
MGIGCSTQNFLMGFADLASVVSVDFDCLVLTNSNNCAIVSSVADESNLTIFFTMSL